MSLRIDCYGVQFPCKFQSTYILKDLREFSFTVQQHSVAVSPCFLIKYS